MLQKPLVAGFIPVILIEAWRTLRLRLRCAVNAYRTAMQYKGKPGERPLEIAREQIRIFLEAVEREYQAHDPSYERTGFFRKEF